jgi:phospholipid transport system transporter-binding protein
MVQIKQIDNRWSIDGDVIIDTVQTVLTVSKALTIESELMVDFAKVNNIDTSAISLILEWKRRAQLENKTLRFVNLPANLISLTQLYGVAELIN